MKIAVPPGTNYEKGYKKVKNYFFTRPHPQTTGTVFIDFALFGWSYRQKTGQTGLVHGDMHSGESGDRLDG
jgi:hypothetical protein